ncbi:MAG: glycosyltransferase family 39 protein [Anaerolineales bacterium]|nr:glycosyltransferase family 39 protein [Anaerolineales bacterium]
MYYATQWGAGLLDWDSFNYIASARSLAAGNGYTIPVDNTSDLPMTHYPPALPTVLALFQLLGVDALAAIRHLNVFLFGANLLLFGLALRKLTGSVYFGLFGGLLFLLSSVFIQQHAWALSEPLLIFFTLLALWFAGEYLDASRNRDLWIAALFSALAFLTKYAGAATGAAIIAGLLVSRKFTWRRKLREGLIVGLIGFLPGLLWAYRSYLLTDTLNNRSLGFHPPVMGNLVEAFYTFYGWYIPKPFLVGNEKWFVLGTIGAVLAVIGVLIYRRRLRDLISTTPTLVWLSMAFIFSYIAVIFFSKTFIDPNIGMSNRMFVPVLPATMLMVLGGMHALWYQDKRWLRTLMVVLGVYLVVLAIAYTRVRLPELHERGLGLARRGVNNSEAIQILENEAADTPIYSNYTYAVYLRTGQAGYKLGSFDPDNVPSKGALLVVFRQWTAEEHPLVKEYKDHIELLIDDPIAAVYLYKP